MTVPFYSQNISLVIPFYNEVGNVTPLIKAVYECLINHVNFELVLVDDGSTDETYGELLACKELFVDCPNVPLTLIRHERQRGQSAALRSGIKQARHGWIITLDGDGQNDPADILRLISVLNSGKNSEKVVVFGNRRIRKDTWGRRLTSRMANGIRQFILGDHCPDSGCSLKLFPRDGFLDLPSFDHMHRFLPSLFQYHGYEIINVLVHHKPRLKGQSKYTFWRRFSQGFFDLIGVLWLKNRSAQGEITTIDRY